jgi:hypothetical protein
MIARKKRDGASVAEAQQETPSTSGRGGGQPLEVGAEARASLMPPEILADRKAKGVRRSLLWGVLGVVAFTVVAVGGTAALGLQAQVSLATAQAQTGELLAQQRQFLEVRKVQDQVTLTKAAQQVGASTEIDWKAYLQSVQSTLPSNVSLTSVSVDSATPLAPYEQPTAPLQGSRVATLTFEASSPELPVVPVWLNSLATLPGFADATPGSVSLDETTKLYTVSITMHINQAAFDNRFDPKEK